MALEGYDIIEGADSLEGGREWQERRGTGGGLLCKADYGPNTFSPQEVTILTSRSRNIGEREQGGKTCSNFSRI